jgi:hypothetical protein
LKCQYGGREYIALARSPKGGTTPCTKIIMRRNGLKQPKMINVNNLRFYKYSEKMDRFYLNNTYIPLKITANGFLKVSRLSGGSMKFLYIKQEYFNSTNSPLWQETINKPLYAIRFVTLGKADMEIANSLIAGIINT